MLVMFVFSVRKFLPPYNINITHLHLLSEWCQMGLGRASVLAMARTGAGTPSCGVAVSVGASCLCSGRSQAGRSGWGMYLRCMGFTRLEWLTSTKLMTLNWKFFSAPCCAPCVKLQVLLVACAYAGYAYHDEGGCL